MIDNSALDTILTSATDLTTVCEIYAADYTPGASGPDPGDALDLYAAVNGVEYLGNTYTRLVKKFGDIKRTITKDQNTATVEFSNVSRLISTFEFTNGFEGLIMVIRLISRGSSDTLAKSLVMFVGRCEKPTSGDKESLTVTAKWILGGLEVQIPRRKFTKDDQEGRVSTDDEFEGFEFIPQYGISTYSVRVRRGGLLGLFGFKKTVQKTLAYSSFSDLDANKPVPEVWGISQIEGTHIGYLDIGATIQLRTAWCEGEIEDIINARSLDDRMPLDAMAYAEFYGQTGSANGDDPSWVASGYYSRTAYITGQADNSAVDAVEPAPDLVAVIQGRLMTIPDGSGDWVTTDTWTDNPAAHVRHLLTSSDYFDLDTDWIDDDEFTTCYDYCAEQIIDRSLTDFVFIKAG